MGGDGTGITSRIPSSKEVAIHCVISVTSVLSHFILLHMQRNPELFHCQSTLYVVHLLLPLVEGRAPGHETKAEKGIPGHETKLVQL